MENPKSTWNVALKYGVITSIASFIFGLIVYATGIYLKSGINYLYYVLLAVGIVFAIKERRDKDLGGYISYGQGFNTGLLVSLVTALIGVVTGYIMMNWIAPEMLGEILKVSEQKMIERGMSEDQIKVGMEMTKRFTTPLWIAVWGFVGITIIGIIMSLIAAAIFKKQDPALPQP
jgi:hypothetical protein